MGELSRKLTEYLNSGVYRFHMPGHKGNSDSLHYQKDITEIDEFDNLHHPEGILKESMLQASKFYGSRKTWYLVNGSTCGILSAIASVVDAGDKIAIARNSHKAAYNAIYLNKLKVSYLYPEFIEEFNINGGITPKSVENLLKEEKDIKAVYITSPTYEGIVSDIKGIADVSHKYGIPLIVDEAHGAHFGISKEFPESALKCGADIVIQSLHKTMNAMTQTALIHTGKNSMVSDGEISKYLGMYQSSSPSYVLMESIDLCINEIISWEKQSFAEYENLLYEFYDEMKCLKNIKIIDNTIVNCKGVFARDMGKLVISLKGTDKNGKWLYDVLRTRYKLQPEMASGDYVICMTSYMDTKDGFKRLQNALKEIDNEVNLLEKKVDIISLKSSIVCEDIYNAMIRERQVQIKLPDSIGRISGEFIYAYPPGIPLVVPGERITGDILAIIEKYINDGLSIQGTEDESCQYIYVLRQ
ncbi:MAG: aminotransferase class I/II-fold pyridoxal phosphate-dependent enzyme [Lachnospiraceae bacterium]|nr:aminotransferase class I/II-fold pyridoxal phosphate-dependent enzyme [Lachnospiraceae bacterium]